MAILCLSTPMIPARMVVKTQHVFILMVYYRHHIFLLKGTIYHEQSNLAWTVTTDQEVSRYEVEFSEDGYTFINAGTVPARNRWFL